MPSTAPCTASSRVMGSSKTMGGAPAALALALRRRRLVLALLGASPEGAAAPAGQCTGQHPSAHIVTHWEGLALHRLGLGYEQVEHKGQGTAGLYAMHAQQTSLSCRQSCT